MGSEDTEDDAAEVSAFESELEARLGIGVDAGERISENEDGYQGDLDDEGAQADDDDEDESLPSGGGTQRGDSGEAESLAVGAAGLAPNASPFGGMTIEQQQAAVDAYRQQQAYYRSAQEADSQRHYQEQRRAPQAEGFNWNLPHEITPAMQMAMRLRGTAAFNDLPQSERDRAEETHQYVANNWDRWTYDPNRFVQDVVMPQLAPALNQVVSQLAEVRAAEFRRKHQADLSRPEDIQRYLHTVQNMQRDPYQAGLEQLRMERLVESLRRGEQDNKTKSKDREALSKSAQGKPAQKNKSKGRRGRRNREVSKADRTNGSSIAHDVVAAMIENGEMTRDQLGA